MSKYDYWFETTKIYPAGIWELSAQVIVDDVPIDEFITYRDKHSLKAIKGLIAKIKTWEKERGSNYDL